MSVANILFLQDRILILTDTLTYQGGSPHGLCERKAVVASTGRFAMVTRGLCDVGDAAIDWIDERAGDLIEAEAAAAEFFDIAADVKASTNPTVNLELTLTGWSPRHNDLRAVQLRIFKNRSGFDVQLLDRGLHLHPAPGSAKVPPPPRNHEAAMVKLALAQHAVMEKREFRDMCIGGVMHLTEVNRDGVAQRIVGLYPGYDGHAAQFGDPNADAVAAFRLSERAAA